MVLAYSLSVEPVSQWANKELVIERVKAIVQGSSVAVCISCTHLYNRASCWYGHTQRHYSVLVCLVNESARSQVLAYPILCNEPAIVKLTQQAWTKDSIAKRLDNIYDALVPHAQLTQAYVICVVINVSHRP